MRRVARGMHTEDLLPGGAEPERRAPERSSAERPSPSFSLSGIRGNTMALVSLMACLRSCDCILRSTALAAFSAESCSCKDHSVHAQPVPKQDPTQITVRYGDRAAGAPISDQPDAVSQARYQAKAVVSGLNSAW